MSTDTPTPNPDCAARNRTHAAHALLSPGGNKPGARCGGVTADDGSDLSECTDTPTPERVALTDPKETP